MSRQSALKRMWNLVGNAAAHRALDTDGVFSLREASLYETQAAEEAELRTWNENEIVLFREQAARHAINVIRKRTRSHRERSVAKIKQEATKAIDEFVAKELERKQDKRR